MASMIHTAGYIMRKICAKHYAHKQVLILL